MIISKYETEDGITIFRLSGKLISATLDKLKAGLDGVIALGGNIRIVVNLKDVGLIDSVAVGLMISRHKLVKKKNGIMRFCCLQPAISKLFSLTDLDQMAGIDTEEEEALDNVRAEAKAKD